MIPDSVTLIHFYYQCDFNQSLDGDWLTSLQFGRSFQQTIKPGQLPDSLTSLKFSEDYKGIIIPGSIQSSVKSLDYKLVPVLSNLTEIPPSTTKLYGNLSNDTVINLGDIPHNVTSLDLNTCHSKIGNSIQANTLPQSLRSLLFSRSISVIPNLFPSNLTSLTLNSYDLSITPNLLPNTLTTLNMDLFNQPLSQNDIPPNLTDIYLSAYNHPLNKQIFPISIVSIKLFRFNQPIPEGYFLKLLRFNNELPVKTLLVSLESLEFGNYQNQLTKEMFPALLTSLKLSNCNQIFNVDQLPQSITILKLCEAYKQPIQFNSLPRSLKKLYLKDNHYYNTISKDPNSGDENNCLPPNLETIFISHKSPSNYNYLDIGNQY